MLAALPSPSRLTPRPYQQEAVAAVLAAAQNPHPRVLVTLPTGTGKTIVFALVLQARSGRALVLAHRDELLQQAVDKLQLVDPTMSIGVVKATQDAHDAPVVVASVQTLSRPMRLARLVPDFTTIIIDEAHHATAASYQRILRHCRAFEAEGPLVLGVTATPERSDGRSLGATFTHLIYQQPLLAMIEAGYLSDLRAIQVELEVDLGAVRVRQGDFVEADLAATLVAANAPAQVLAAFQQHAAARKALLFTPTVATAYAMVETFRAAGITAEALEGRTPPDERQRLLDRLRRGETQMVANCAVLTEGFDEPSLDCIIIARPTRSRALYQQMIGRGTRLHPGKTDCLVLDVVGTSTQHEVHTVASLFALPADALAAQTVTSVIAARQRQEHEQQEAIAGTLRSTPVDLFTRRALHWVQTRQGAWVLSLGAHGTLRLTPDGAETWQVAQSKRDTAPVLLAATLPLAYAQGLAEDVARRTGVMTLLDTEAPWRQEPASTKQLALLDKLGIASHDGLTKGEAAELITAVLGDWA